MLNIFEQADLSKPETIPATLVGVHIVIDCATARPEEPIKTVDWEGKVALIQCAKAMGIQKYVFYSIHNCDKHPEVPLMEIKYCTEKFLKDSGLTHIIIRLCGFMQVNSPKLKVLTSDTVFSIPMTETYNLLGVDFKDIITLEKYLQDYFTNILKKLKDLKAQSKQSDIFIRRNIILLL
ncbi:protein HIGH CHLOROPHYLL FLUORESCENCE PHENOTYPE 244, chloroplastic [Pistacia vera]|uniref:protein HIGH CHLOROPHYLL FLUORESCENCE PHENOTYPE 244, chloroplastic n=1 Tax=Pistacia vera TaxID=55513 RepID=UPI001263821A|nr:protein HIGH CHLOROPHYLL FLUORESCENCE PHENOTYPE 244, chloroplastic [Pistacia vera]